MTRPPLLVLAAILITGMLTCALAAPPEAPPSATPSVAMCGPDEPGERLQFFGRVLNEGGQPIPNASIIAYSTDINGLYVPAGSRSCNPRICGVAVSDRDGWYRFDTIRPGGYPGRPDPAHIHLHADAAVHRHTYITFYFEDDARLTPAVRRNLDDETVVVRPALRDDGVWTFRHDITLRGS